jgi:hypothetical protein
VATNTPQNIRDTSRCAGCDPAARVRYAAKRVREEIPRLSPRHAQMAALRDASFYRNPDTHRVKVWHVIGEGGRARCGFHALCLNAPVPVGTVHEDGRCRRSGCAEAWPTVVDKRAEAS